MKHTLEEQAFIDWLTKDLDVLITGHRAGALDPDLDKALGFILTWLAGRNIAGIQPTDGLKEEPKILT